VKDGVPVRLNITATENISLSHEAYEQDALSSIRVSEWNKSFLNEGEKEVVK
jgi:hypothetical protein